MIDISWCGKSCEEKCLLEIQGLLVDKVATMYQVAKWELVGTIKNKNTLSNDSDIQISKFGA